MLQPFPNFNLLVFKRKVIHAAAHSFVRKPLANSKAMKLGGKSKDVDSFVDQLKSEGESVNAAPAPNRSTVKSVTPSLPQIKTDK